MIQYDLVVFGATGFTAKFVLTEIMLEARWPLNFSWVRSCPIYTSEHRGYPFFAVFHLFGRQAIAGRSEKALLEIRKIISVSAQENHGPLPNIIVADVNDEPSLFKMARSTKRMYIWLQNGSLVLFLLICVLYIVLLNCVGPYRHFGEPVVSACIAAKCDYIDLCGELTF